MNWLLIAVIIFHCASEDFSSLKINLLFDNSMKKLVTTKTGRLRIVGFFEGVSLIVLVLIAMPIKYILGDHSWVKAIGPVHGFLFVLFVINTISVALVQRWKFKTTTWKVLLSCMIPFGTFYVDKTILSKISESETQT